MGMLLVNSMAHLKYGQDLEVFSLLLHAPWDGLTISDLVFPAFILMLGLAVPLSLKRVKDTTGLTAAVARKILGRSARLFVVGLVLGNLEWVFDTEGTAWLLWDVLQRIALVYAATAILYLACSPRTLLIIAVATLVLYWPLCLLPSLDGLPIDVWTRGPTVVSSVDRVMLGDHAMVKGFEGYDPEGLLSTLPAIAQALIGVLIGMQFQVSRGRALARQLAIAGAVMLLTATPWAFVFPVVKDIWSSTFVLVTSGLTVLALAVLHLWLDDDATPARGVLGGLVTVPVAFGLNAIAAYVLHQLTGDMLGWKPMLELVRLFKPLLGEKAAALLPAAVLIALIWAVVEVLRRRGRVITI